MAAGTTAPSYWLNWRFFLCAIWTLLGMVFAALLIWRYEGRSKSRDQLDQQEVEGCLYDDEVWGTCSKSICPAWLLAYRIIAFVALLALLLFNIIIAGGGIYFFYTEWTFTLVTIYFGLGSLLSMHGWRHYWHQVEADRDYRICKGEEHGSYVLPSLDDNADIPYLTERLNFYGELNCRTAASVWGYAFQIIFQMSAGAVVLTDLVFWLIIYTFLTPSYYRLSFLVICKHSVNAVLLLGDAILNHLVISKRLNSLNYFDRVYDQWNYHLLPEVPLLSNSIFCSMDMYIHCFPVDHPCLHINKLALCFHGLVISICSLMVLSCGAASFSMFWDLCSRTQDKAMLFFKITCQWHITIKLCRIFIFSY